MESNVKISVDVDITPAEMRDLMGLPDVSGLHEDMMERIRKSMMAGEEGYDPLSLFRPYMSSSMAGFEGFQKLMSAAFGMSAGNSAGKSARRDDKE